MEPKLDLRWATTDDGDALAALAASAGVVFRDFALDWSDPGHTWLVAADEGGALLGAIQVFAGQPFGRMEMMMIEGALPQEMRWPVVRALTDRAAALLARAGSQAVLASIDQRDPHFLDVAQGRGWRPMHQATFILKRLR